MASETVDAYAEILETGREKLKDGDFLKLADFLSKLNKESEIIEPFKRETQHLDITLQFETLKGKSFVITLLERKCAYYPGKRRNEFYISGIINGKPFIDDDEFVFIDKWTRFMKLYGIKNIKRTWNEFGLEEEFTTLGKYKDYLQEEHENDKTKQDEEDEDDGEPYDVRMICDTYITRSIMGFHSLTD